VIAIASTVVFFRVIVVIGVTSPSSFARIAPPLAVMFGILAACVGGMFLLRRPERTGMPPQGNPSEMRSAVVFALLFTVVLFAVAAAQEMFGSQGLYVVAILSGLTDMDAITLSTMQMTEAQRVDPDTAWRVILAAALSNLLFKCAMVIVLGRRLLFARLAVYFGISILAGVLILFLWPPV
jgi:uncharacterized membrane protein (DUF4010 family)